MALCGPTLMAIYSRVPRGRALQIMLELVGWSMVLELSHITLQAARGACSHFTEATTFDSAVWAGMSTGIGVFTVVSSSPARC